MDRWIKQEGYSKWKEQALLEQKNWCEKLCDRKWDEYPRSNDLYLKIKIGLIAFGFPNNLTVRNDKNSESFSISQCLELYNASQTRVINNIAKIVMGLGDQSKELYAAIILIVFWDGNEMKLCPIIRVLKDVISNNDHCFFVDITGRVYSDWSDFLINNKLPDCIYCAPINGFYELENDNLPKLEIVISPAARTLKKIGKGMDSAFLVAMIVGSIGLGVSATIPPLFMAAMAVTGASSAWSITRTGINLADKKKHKESLALTNKEALLCYLSLTVDAFGLLSAGVTSFIKLASLEGRAIAKAAESGLNITGKVSKVGATITTGMREIIKPLGEEKLASDKLNCENFYHLVLLLFFFKHSIINFDINTSVIYKVREYINVNHIQSSNVLTKYKHYSWQLKQVPDVLEFCRLCEDYSIYICEI